LTDVFAIQDKISRNIINNLRLNLGRGRRRYETSVEAYDLYLRARALQSRGLSFNDQSIGPFEEAIAKDSSFAPAYAGLAAAYVLRSGASNRYPGRDGELASLRATAEKAIQLDPLLAEATRWGWPRTRWPMGTVEKLPPRYWADPGSDIVR
jgi:serine/threonine-protein kinase